MAVSTRVHQLIRESKFDELEDHWLSAMAEKPTEVSYFVGIARALSGTGEEDRAQTLLELWDDQIRGQELWDARLQMLEKAGHLLIRSGRIHPALLSAVRAKHADHPSLEGLIEVVGLAQGGEDIDKAWSKVRRLESLLMYEEGAVVEMKGKGVGRIIEVNMQLESFKIDLERHPTVRIGFSAASKMLNPLEKQHILRRKLEDMPALEKLAKEDPSELLRLVLESFGEPLAAGTVKETVLGIIADSKWTSWWAAARKHDQVVVTGTGGRQRYAWASSGEDATAAIRVRFDKAKLSQQVQMFKQNADRDDDLKDLMSTTLGLKAAGMAKKKPGQALEIWYTLEKEGAAAESDNWSAAKILSKGLPNDAGRIVASIGARLLRERSLDVIREHREDWTETFASCLAYEEEGKTIERIVADLRDVDPEAIETFYDEVMSAPRKRPGAFTWLAERAITDEELRQRNPARLLRQLITAAEDDSYGKYRTRLGKLFASGQTVPKLLAELDEEQAAKMHEAIARAPIDEGQQRALITALETRFASLRDESEAVQPLYATIESIDRTRKEYFELKETEIPANRTAIQEAREMGDLRENFEYKAARQRHEYLSSRLAQLDNDLSRVQPIDFEGLDVSTVRIGSKIGLESAKGPQTITILGPWESAPEDGIISYESDLAKEMLGKKVDSEINLSGKPAKIVSISSAK